MVLELGQHHLEGLLDRMLSSPPPTPECLIHRSGVERGDLFASLPGTG